jgi:hypothetical protein
MNHFKTIFLSILVFISVGGYSQFTYPIDMEGTYGAGELFVGFGGTVTTVVPNPDPNPPSWNTSANVLKIDKGNQTWAGMEFRAAVPIPAGTFGAAGTAPNFCFDYYTTAPVGYQILFKFNGSPDMYQTATVSGTWSQVCFTPPVGSNGSDWPVIIFRNGTGGNTSDPNFTLYVDNLMYYADADVPVLPLSFTTDSEYFCPGQTVNLVYTQGKGGPYTWYTEPKCGTLVESGSSYTTPILTSDQAYYVQDESAIIATGSRQVGPTGSGTPLNGFSTTGSQFFTNNMANGSFLDAVRMRQHVPTGSPAGGCVFIAQAINITQGITSSVTMNGGSTNNTDIPFNFSTSGSTGALPMNYCDELELRITTSTSGCYVTQSASGGQNLFVPFPNETSPELTFTSATYNAGVSSGNNFLGTNYWIRGNLLAPRIQVNALADVSLCPDPLSNSSLKLKATKLSEVILLQWTDESESNENNDIYEVQRNTDGLSFETIAILYGKDSEINYSYKDSELELLNGNVYYKIKRINNKTNILTSNIELVKINSLNNISIYPNPAKQSFFVLGSLDNDQKIQIKAIDMLGKEVYSSILFLKKGEFKKEINFSSYAKGVYTIQIVSTNEMNTIKLIKK